MRYDIYANSSATRAEHHRATENFPKASIFFGPATIVQISIHPPLALHVAVARAGMSFVEVHVHITLIVCVSQVLVHALLSSVTVLAAKYVVCIAVPNQIVFGGAVVYSVCIVVEATRAVRGGRVVVVVKL